MLKPTRDFLLVEVEEVKDKEDTTRSGIIVLKKTDDRDLQMANGKVLDTGPDVKEFKKGQVVYYNFFSGNQLWVDDKQYHVVVESDVLGVE